MVDAVAEKSINYSSDFLSDSKYLNFFIHDDVNVNDFIFKPHLLHFSFKKLHINYGFILLQFNDYLLELFNQPFHHYTIFYDFLSFFLTLLLTQQLLDVKHS